MVPVGGGVWPQHTLPWQICLHIFPFDRVCASPNQEKWQKMLQSQRELEERKSAFHGAPIPTPILVVPLLRTLLQILPETSSTQEAVLMSEDTELFASEVA